MFCREECAQSSQSWLEGSKPLSHPHVHPSPQSLAPLARPRPYSPIPTHFGGPPGTLQSQCCLLPSAPTLPLWEAQPSRILSESQMRSLTISVVVASAMCSRGLHTKYVYVFENEWVVWGWGGVSSRQF